MPENPTLLWALGVAIAALAPCVVYLFKRNEQLRDKNEENLKLHNKEVRGLLEKTLVSFNEVEKAIVAGDIQQKETIKETIRDSQDKIIEEMKRIVDGSSRKN